MKKFEWIALDLDGTLIDSTNELYKNYQGFLKEFNCKGSKKEFHELNGPKISEIISILKKKYKIKQKKIELEKKYNKKIELSYKNKIQLKKDAKKLLEFLKKDGYKIGLVTSASYKNTISILTKYNILKYFSAMSFGDDVKNSKPHPEIYLKFLKKIKMNDKNVLVIEDSQNGYSSAKNANLTCLKVQNLNNLIKKLSKINDKKYEVINAKEISVTYSPINRKISNSQKKKINNIWKNEQKNRKKKLFNSKVLTLRSINKNKNSVSLLCDFTDYKNIIASRIDSSIGLEIRQVGISGMILFEDKKIKYTIFAKRSKNNTEYPDYYELVPSGNLDIFSEHKKRNLDYKSKLLEELEEESKISKSKIKNITERCIVLDKINLVYDIGCIIKMDLDKTSSIQNLRKSSEYSIPKIIKIKDVPQFVKKHNTKIVPTSLGLLENLLKNL